jgi:hypothetical protein
MRRTTIAKRSLKAIRRAGGVAQNPVYLEFIRQWPCVLAAARDCEGNVEAAHVGDRGLGQKSKDEQAIPLCAGHHRTRSDSQHVMGRGFWEYHGINRADLFTFYQGIFEGVGGGKQ